MTDFGQLLPVLIGGGLTLLGALALRWLDIGRENRQQKAELIGAVHAVRQELTSNITMLTQANDLTRVASVRLDDTTYRSVRLLLARTLPRDLSNEVAKAYGIWLSTAVALIEAIKSTQRLMTEGEFKTLGALADQMHRANDQLQKFFTNTLKQKD